MDRITNTLMTALATIAHSGINDPAELKKIAKEALHVLYAAQLPRAADGANHPDPDGICAHGYVPANSCDICFPRRR